MADVPLRQLLTALNGKLAAILGQKFVQSKPVKLGTGDSIEERTVYRLQSIVDDRTFVQALMELANS